MLILIRWLCQKPTYLDLQCLKTIGAQRGKGLNLIDSAAQLGIFLFLSIQLSQPCSKQKHRLHVRHVHANFQYSVKLKQENKTIYASLRENMPSMFVCVGD